MDAENSIAQQNRINTALSHGSMGPMEAHAAQAQVRQKELGDLADKAAAVRDGVEGAADVLDKTATVVLAGKAMLGAVGAVRRGAIAAPTASPLPGSYINTGYTIDMAGAPAASAANAAGFARNGPWFWRQLLGQHPELFSASNKALIARGRAPVVDATWVAGNPTHQSFLGDTLIHHHIDQGGIATALPQRVHRAWHSIWHPE